MVVDDCSGLFDDGIVVVCFIVVGLFDDGAVVVCFIVVGFFVIGVVGIEIVDVFFVGFILVDVDSMFTAAGVVIVVSRRKHSNKKNRTRQFHSSQNESSETSYLELIGMFAI